MLSLMWKTYYLSLSPHHSAVVDLHDLCKHVVTLGPQAVPATFLDVSATYHPYICYICPLNISTI